MAKKSPSDRIKDIEEIAQRRSASFEEPNGPREGEQRDESQREFTYTDEQRNVIASEFGLDGASAAASVDAIELIVRLTAEALRYRADHPISPEQEKKFRDLTSSSHFDSGR